MRIAVTLSTLTTLALLASPLRAQATLGGQTFNDAQFGTTVVASDGGTSFTNSWISTTNANPGLVALLTGANFNSGVANIGFGGPPVSYTIGYSTPIVNGAGNDFAVVVARFSTDDFFLSLSEDGVNFGAESAVLGSQAVDGLESRSFFYAGTGPYTGRLWMHLLDLNDYGIANGASVAAIRVRGTTQLDLVRVAGMNPESMGTVPEPSSWALMATGFAALAGMHRRRTQRATKA